MSITARHKKPGAFRLLVTSMETTPPERREKIMNAIQADDPELAAHLQKSLFSFAEFSTLGDLALAEIIGEFQNEMRTVALALYKCKDEALVAKFLRNMAASTAAGYKEAAEELKEVKVREQVSAQFRMIAKARELEKNARLKLKSLSGNYPI